MIMNLWNNIELYCGHHDEPQKMDVDMKGKTISYNCSNENCKCKIALKDFEKMLDHISKTLYDAELKDEKLYLENYKWKHKKYEYKVFEHNEKIKLTVSDKELL